MPVVMGGMHEADNTYSIWSTWLCYQLVQFLITAYISEQLLQILLDFTDLLDMSFSLSLYFLPVLSLGEQRLLNSEILSYFSGVIMGTK